MSEKKAIKPVALAVGAALASSFAITNVAQADGANPFSMTNLTVGYMMSVEGKDGDGVCGGDKEEKDGEGSCGEGSCGGDKEGKGGEGSCGEGSCGGDKGEEGKCGEGSCGGSV